MNRPAGPTAGRRCVGGRGVAWSAYGAALGGKGRDMLTKQIFPKHFERLRRVMMGHENFDDMCERYQDAKAAGDNADDPKVFYKPERPPK